MELVVTRGGYSSSSSGGDTVYNMVRHKRKRMGYIRGVAVPVRDDDVVSGLDMVSRAVGKVGVEGEAEEMGSRSDILAHSGKLLANNADGSAYSGVLGMDAVHLRMGVRDNRYGDGVPETEGP